MLMHERERRLFDIFERVHVISSVFRVASSILLVVVL